MTANYCAFQKSVEGPAWRSKLVERLPRQRSHDAVKACDEHVRRLHHYRCLCAHGGAGVQQALARYPAIAGAEALNRTDQANMLKIAVLGGLDAAEIRQRLGVEAAVLDGWEKIYFDVRDMREAVQWIEAQVIEPERAAGHDELVRD